MCAADCASDKNILELVECDACGLYVLKNLYSEHLNICTHQNSSKQMSVNYSDSDVSKVVSFLNSPPVNVDNIVVNSNNTKIKEINLPSGTMVSCSFCKNLVNISNLKSHLVSCKQKITTASKILQPHKQQNPMYNQHLESPEFIKNLKEISLPADCSVLCSYCKSLVVVETLKPHLQSCKQKYLSGTQAKVNKVEFKNKYSNVCKHSPKPKKFKGKGEPEHDHLYSRNVDDYDFTEVVVKQEQRFFDLSKKLNSMDDKSSIKKIKSDPTIGTNRVKTEIQDDFIIGI